MQYARRLKVFKTEKKPSRGMKRMMQSRAHRRRPPHGQTDATAGHSRAISKDNFSSDDFEVSMTSRNTFSNGSLKKALKEALTQHIENNDPTTVFIIHET